MDDKNRTYVEKVWEKRRFWCNIKSLTQMNATLNY